MWQRLLARVSWCKDEPAGYGAFWGEAQTNVHKALGCLGTGLPVQVGAGLHVHDVEERDITGVVALGAQRALGTWAGVRTRTRTLADPVLLVDGERLVLQEMDDHFAVLDA